MLPLTMASQGEPVTIKKIGGKQETKKFLETLGFVVGGTITVVSEINGNMIVNVKDSRVAIGKDMANKIMVSFVNILLVIFPRLAYYCVKRKVITLLH